MKLILTKQEIDKIAIELANKYSADVTDPVRSDIYNDSLRAILKTLKFLNKKHEINN